MVSFSFENADKLDLFESLDEQHRIVGPTELVRGAAMARRQ